MIYCSETINTSIDVKIEETDNQFILHTSIEKYKDGVLNERVLDIFKQELKRCFINLDFSSDNNMLKVQLTKQL